MKKVLRKQTLQELKSLSAEEKEVMDAWLTEQLLLHPFYKEAKTIATYLSFPHEFQTARLIEEAQKDGKNILIPKTYSQGKMDFVLYKPEQLEKNSFGLLEPQGDFTILEPSQIDLIHVPGLAFNPSDYRIGYGGGYYDRYLEHFPGHTISTIYPCQIQNFHPEPHDVPVKEVIMYERDF